MEELLNVVGHQTLAIYMRGINQADLTSVLELIYKGETRVSSTNVSHFLSVAKELKLLDTYDSDNSKNEFEKEYSRIEESVMEPNEKVNICDETQKSMFNILHKVLKLIQNFIIVANVILNQFINIM